MIREFLAGHGSTLGPVVFLLGCLGVYLAVVIRALVGPRGREELDHVASLPLADDTGIENAAEGRKA